MNTLQRRPETTPGRTRFLLLVLLACLVFPIGCRRPDDLAEHASLRLTTRALGPDSTFEVTFDEPVAAHDALGSPAESPLAIDPPLPGTFVWRGRRTGIFTPTEPLRLGTRYVVSIRSGLRDAGGKPVNARLRRVLETPGLEVTLERQGWWSDDDMPAMPVVSARFNAMVDAAELARHARFTDGHQSVPAVATEIPGEPESSGAAGAEPIPADPARVPAAISSGRSFELRPARALESTNLWELRITAGLSARGVGTRTGQESIARLGRAIPFALVSIEAANEVHGGRKVRLRFTRPVSRALATNALSAWFRCEPAVSNLVAERSGEGRVVAVGGAFELGTEYAVAIEAGLPGEEPVALRHATATRVRFEPIRPTVWLQAFDAVQLAGGGRSMDLLALNTPETRVRIKALDRHGLIPALRAYERYLRPENGAGPDVLAGSPVVYAALSGHTVHDTNVDTRANVDEATRHSLRWDDVAGGEPRGAYFVETHLHRLPAPAGEPSTRTGPQALVQLTDLGLVTKTGARATWVWVFSHSTAKPIVGAKVSLRGAEDTVLAEATTDADGLARFVRHEAAEWVMAETEGDFHAERLAGNVVSVWQYRLPGGWENPAEPTLYAFTDREAYRPGELLHLKVLARRWENERWEFPTNRSLQLGVHGPRGDLVLRTNLALGARGSTDWSWTLPTGTRGTWRIQLECGTSRLDHDVEIRDFQPAAFEVSLAAKHEYDATGTISVPFAARYLFGQDLARARLLWTATAEDFAFAPKEWSAFAFCQGTLDWRFREHREVPGQSHSTGRSEIAAGTPRVIVPAIPPNPVAPQPQRVRLSAEVTDLDQQTVAGHAEFVRHSSAFYLGFRWKHGNEAVLATNAPLSYQLVAVRNDGQPWTAPVAAKARLRRVEWKSVAVQRAGRVVGYQSEPEYHEVSESRVTPKPSTRVGARWETTDNDATGDLGPLPTPGQYLLELSATDDDGFPVLTTVEFHVSGDARIAWHHRNGAEVELVPDTPTHAPGDTATLLVKAPFDATALVTVEREDVRRAFAVRLHGNADAIRVPVGTNDSPNIFIGVTLVRGSRGNPHAYPMPEWRVGYETLWVPSERDRLRVEIETRTNVFRPGEPVRVRARVRDAAGNTVPDAETTLYAVDEGYWVLKGTEAPDPAGAFAEPRRLGVTTTLSLPALLPEDPQFRAFGNKGHLAGGGGQSTRTRRIFVPCPSWNASLVTDAHGEVTVSFAAPDSLSRYRIVAVACHGARSMGTGTGGFEVRKPLMIESAMPRFAHVGDLLVARALVFNHSGHAASVRADLVPPAFASFASAHDGPARIDIASEGTAIVEFPVRIDAAGAGEWKWSVATDSLSDSMVVSMPATRAEAGIREIRHIRWGAGSTNLLAAADSAILGNPDLLTVRVASSPIAFLGEGVHQLVHYPYGCVEQTGSSLLPWIALRDFPALLPPDQRAATNISTVLATGVQRLWSMQTQEGGLAYWPGGTTPNRWGSAYGAWILALARDSGADVDPRRLARLHHWLDEQWHGDPPNPDAGTLHVRCLTAFAFAFATESDAAHAGLVGSLHDARDRLTPEDRALLAVAMIRTRDDRDGALELLRMPPGRGPSHGQFGSDARVDALRLLAHTAIDPVSRETTALLDSLAAGQRGGHWTTTQGNAWAIWAIAEHARRTGPANAAVGEIRAGATVRRFAIGSNDGVAEFRFPIAAGDVPAGVFVSHAMPFPLLAEVTLAGHRQAGTNPPAAIHRGFGLRRTYRKLDDGNHPLPPDALVVGDRVLVTLEIDAPDPAEWVAIEDPLPAILEPLQGAFKTDGQGSGAAEADDRSDFSEVRSDRRFAFIDALSEGRHRLRYLARVRAAGDVVAAPARIEAMYEPQRHGFSEGTRLRAAAGDANRP